MIVIMIKTEAEKEEEEGEEGRQTDRMTLTESIILLFVHKIANEISLN